MVFDSGVKGLERLLCHAKRPGMHCWQCSRFSPRGERNPFLRLSSVRRFRMAAERPLCPGLPGTQRAQPSTAQWRQSINLGGPSKASTSAYVGLGFFLQISADHLSSGMVAFSTVPRRPHSWLQVTSAPATRSSQSQSSRKPARCAGRRGAKASALLELRSASNAAACPPS